MSAEMIKLHIFFAHGQFPVKLQSRIVFLDVNLTSKLKKKTYFKRLTKFCVWSLHGGARLGRFGEPSLCFYPLCAAAIHFLKHTCISFRKCSRFMARKFAYTLPVKCAAVYISSPVLQLKKYRATTLKLQNCQCKNYRAFNFSVTFKLKIHIISVTQ